MRFQICLRFLAVPVLLALAISAAPQSTTYGRLMGIVKDSHGLVLPGVSVTLYGNAVMGEYTIVTEVDGRYLFQALQPASYNLRFEMSGFAALAREEVVVATGTTITIDASLQLAGVEESLTIVGESPTLDAKTTRVGATFDLTALQDVPSATDMWSVLAQSPGIRMLGYDGGGSHKAQQTRYETFGLRWQNRIVSDGVDSTEGIGGSGFYYDYYSIEEFQVSASGLAHNCGIVSASDSYLCPFAAQACFVGSSTTM